MTRKSNKLVKEEGILLFLIHGPSLLQETVDIASAFYESDDISCGKKDFVSASAHSKPTSSEQLSKFALI